MFISRKICQDLYKECTQFWKRYAEVYYDSKGMNDAKRCLWIFL